MKFKLRTMILNKLLFIAGIIGILAIFFDFKLTIKIETILSIFLIIGSMSEFIETLKLRKLIYPLIIIYFIIVMPIIDKFIDNRVLYVVLVILSLVNALIIIYNEVINTIKGKNR